MVCEYEQAVQKSGNQNASLLNRQIENAQIHGNKRNENESNDEIPHYTQQIGKIRMFNTECWRGYG